MWKNLPLEQLLPWHISSLSPFFAFTLHKQIVSSNNASSRKLGQAGFLVPFALRINLGSFLQCGHNHVFETLVMERQTKWKTLIGHSGLEQDVVGSSEVLLQ